MTVQLERVFDDCGRNDGARAGGTAPAVFTECQQTIEKATKQRVFIF